MDTRNNPSTHVESELSSFDAIMQQILIEAAKIGIIGPSIAITLFPLEIAVQILQTKKSLSLGQSINSFFKNGSTARTAILLEASKSLGRGLNNSIQASTIKNCVVGQRDNLSEFIINNSGQKEDVIAANKTLTPLQTIAVSGSISIVDTILTHPSSSFRIMHIETLNQNSNFQIPEIKNFADRIKIFQNGFTVRATKNFIAIGGLVVNPILTAKLTNDFSANPVTAEIAATSITSLFVGTLTNAYDVVYKNLILQTNPTTLKAPSGLHVAKHLLATEGVRAFKRGLGTSVLITCVVQGTLPRIEAFADKMVNKFVQNRETLFSQSRTIPLEDTGISNCPFRHP